MAARMHPCHQPNKLQTGPHEAKTSRDLMDKPSRPAGGEAEPAQGSAMKGVMPLAPAGVASSTSFLDGWRQMSSTTLSDTETSAVLISEALHADRVECEERLSKLDTKLSALGERRREVEAESLKIVRHIAMGDERLRSRLRKTVVEVLEKVCRCLARDCATLVLSAEHVHSHMSQ